MALKIRTEKLLTCPICGSGSIETYLSGYDYETNTGSYNIDSCIQCGIKFTNPRPVAEDLPKLYEARNTSDFVTSSSLIDILRSLSIRRFLSQLPKEVLESGKTILDYGCGDGFFANEISKFDRNLKIIATDFHKSAPTKISENTGITYIAHDYLKNDNVTFDAIFCRHVLEHSLNPIELVEFLGERLNRGGYIVMEVPNSQSIWSVLLKRFYFSYYLPRHLFHFDMATLGALFRSKYEFSIKGKHTPLLGRSIGYLTKTSIQNIGIFGLTLYPLQIFADALAGSSTVLLLIAKKV